MAILKAYFSVSMLFCVLYFCHDNRFIQCNIIEFKESFFFCNVISTLYLYFSHEYILFYHPCKSLLNEPFLLVFSLIVTEI